MSATKFQLGDRTLAPEQGGLEALHTIAAACALMAVQNIATSQVEAFAVMKVMHWPCSIPAIKWNSHKAALPWVVVMQLHGAVNLEIRRLDKQPKTKVTVMVSEGESIIVPSETIIRYSAEEAGPSVTVTAGWIYGRFMEQDPYNKPANKPKKPKAVEKEGGDEAESSVLTELHLDDPIRLDLSDSDA